MEKREYVLNGLCCANCGAKIEREVDQLPEVHEASLNMNNNRLLVYLKDGDSTISDKVKKIVASHEPDIKVEDCSKKKTYTQLHEHSNEYSHEHSHSHNPDSMSEEGEEEIPWTYLCRLGMALLIITAFSFFKVGEEIRLIAYVVAYLMAGYEVLVTAAKNIRRGNVFDENFLMGVASIGAFLIGEHVEAVSVLIFYGLGEFIQDMAVHRSKKNIAGLMDIRPDSANLIIGDEIRTVRPEEIQVGDRILVKPGEKIPLDGTVVKGSSYVDTRALTGESVPTEVQVGDMVLSGSINNSGLIEMVVTKLFSESTVSKILELVQNAGHKKAQSEKFITRFARYYTPIVVFTALGVGILPPFFGFGAFSTWIYRALSFLIISCPCALVISIPLSFFGGIGGAARHGVLIKGGNYLDSLNYVDTIVFDKTGTLTHGVFHVTEVHAVKKGDDNQLIQMAVLAESNSVHPIAKSLMQYYETIKREISLDKIQLTGMKSTVSVEDIISEVKISEKAGYGMIASIEHDVIYAGNLKLMKESGIIAEEPSLPGTIVHVGFNSEYLGYILIQDKIKEGLLSKMKELKTLGVNKLVMLTGDRENIAREVAISCGIDEYHANLLPQDKVTLFEKYQDQLQEKSKIVFVGDGINDAPVLARADIGIAMGGIGSDAAIEAADVVIMQDDIGALVTAIKVAKKTRRIVMENIVFALGVKILIMILAFLGITSIWFAIFADVGVALLALINSLRAMKIKQQ